MSSYHSEGLSSQWTWVVACATGAMAMSVGFLLTYQPAGDRLLYSATASPVGAQGALHRPLSARPQATPRIVVGTTRWTGSAADRRSAVRAAAGSVPIAPVTFSSQPVVWLTQFSQTIVAQVLALGVCAKVFLVLGVVAVLLGIKQVLQPPKPSPITRLNVQAPAPPSPLPPVAPKTPVAPTQSATAVQLPVRTPPVQVPVVVPHKEPQVPVPTRPVDRVTPIIDPNQRKATPLPVVPKASTNASPSDPIESSGGEDGLGPEAVGRRALIGIGAAVSLAGIFKDQIFQNRPDSRSAQANASVPQRGPIPEIKAVSNPEPKPAVESKLQPETKLAPKAEVKPQPQPNPKPKSEAQRQPEPETPLAAATAAAIAAAGLFQDPETVASPVSEALPALEAVGTQITAIPLPDPQPTLIPQAMDSSSVAFQTPDAVATPASEVTVPVNDIPAMVPSFLPEEPIAIDMPTGPVDATELLTSAPIDAPLALQV